MKKLRWGLIGCGDIAEKRVAPALRDIADAELVAVSRARPDKLQEFAARFSARKYHSSWQELVADPEIDAVYIATPVYLHAPQTLVAAQSGKHVLCEKPMALDVSECDRMVDACRRSGVKLGVAYYRRFYPVVARIKEILEKGEIGVPVLGQINAFESFNPGPGHARHWFVEKKKAGGGPLMDFGCHRIEVFLNILGRVRGVEANVGRVVFEREVEDTAIGILEMERGTRVILAVTHAARERQDSLDIFGSRGSIHVPVLNEGRLTVKSADGDRQEFHPPHRNIHQPLIEDFTRAVLEAREPEVGGEVGREVARITAMLYGQRSADV
jgi:predicted dehydrogenase